MGNFCFVIMTHWTKSNAKQCGKSWALLPAYLGSLQRAICMLHVPLPSVNGSQNSPQHVSQSVHPWMAEYLLLKMWSETKSTSHHVKLAGNTISGSIQDLLNQNLHLDKIRQWFHACSNLSHTGLQNWINCKEKKHWKKYFLIIKKVSY